MFFMRVLEALKKRGVRYCQEGGKDMITPINERVIVGLPKSTDPDKQNKSVPEPKVVLRIEEKHKKVPEDQVGQCDNLTASYWG